MIVAEKLRWITHMSTPVHVASSANDPMGGRHSFFIKAILSEFSLISHCRE